MTDLTLVDYVLGGVIAVLAVIGLFKGLSGWLGTCVGAIAASVGGTFLFGTCKTLVAQIPFVAHGGFCLPAAVIVDFLFALIIFGFVRAITVRGISALVPQPLNALIGLVAGLVVGLVGVGLLASTAFLEGARLQEGTLASHSTLVHMMAVTLDTYLESNQP